MPSFDGELIMPLTHRGERVICAQKNTTVYLHERQHAGDHIYVTGKDRTTREDKHLYIWKREITPESGMNKWERYVKNLGHIGCNFIVAEFMEEGDIDNYKTRFGDIPEKDPYNIDEHKERAIQFFGYMLESGIIVPDSFNGEAGQ